MWKVIFCPFTEMVHDACVTLVTKAKSDNLGENVLSKRSRNDDFCLITPKRSFGYCNSPNNVKRAVLSENRLKLTIFD